MKYISGLTIRKDAVNFPGSPCGLDVSTCYTTIPLGEEIAAPLSCLSRGIECFEEKLIIPRDELSLECLHSKDPCPLARCNRSGCGIHTYYTGRALREAFLYSKPFDYRTKFTPFISKVAMWEWALESLNPRILEPFIKKI